MCEVQHFWVFHSNHEIWGWALESMGTMGNLKKVKSFPIVFDFEASTGE